MYKIGILLIACYICSASALPPCVCARDFHPVCGSNGNTYPNNCMLECAAASTQGLTLAHEGSCEPSPPTCICTYEYKPVCGIDGTTYPNQCSLGCEKSRNPALRKQHDGPCKSEVVSEKIKVTELPKLPTCTCARNLEPVCGTDGVTYSNLCMLECAAQNKPLAKKADGPCKSEDASEKIKVAELPKLPTCTCARNLEPVCGTDGVTYSNLCMLECAAQNKPLAKNADGPCKSEDASEKIKVAELPKLPTCTCARNLEPVCGTDGVTYSNLCMLECAAQNKPLAKNADGPCKSEDASEKIKVAELPKLPTCTCARNLEPVCGTDGVTYSNLCMLECAAQNKPLAKNADGPCKSEDASEKIKVADLPKLPTCTCARNLEPVCGTDGVTYSNLCMLECAAQNKPLAKNADGPCKSEDASEKIKVAELPKLPTCTCARNFEPVCGTDGVTYSNLCMLECAAQNKPLAKKADGPCKSEDASEKIKVAELPKLPTCTCARNLEPVCGTDGVTYSNLCMLECAAQNKPLAKKADGPCDGLTVKVVEELREVEPPKKSCVCFRNYRPVCGSDGTTYGNSCVLGCRSNSEPSLRMVHDGPC